MTMRSLLVFALLFFAQTGAPAVSSPKAGEVLRGKIQIVGDLGAEAFASAELSFAYASAPETFFPIQEFSQPPADQNLALWDTTLIADGDYILRLRLFFLDGTQRDVVVPDLKVRNDEIPPTETPAPTEEPPAPAETAPPPAQQPPTPTPIFPTPTPLPPNPAALAPVSILLRFAQGGLAAVVVILLLSLILRSRKD